MSEDGLKKKMGNNSEKKEKPILGVLFILIAGICWGCIGIFVRTFNEAGLGSMEIVALRAVVTAGLMLLFLLATDRKKLKIRWKDLWCFLGTGICSMVLFNYCYFRMVTMVSLSVAAVMLYTAPVFVMLMSAVLFKERITAVKLIALAATVVGCAFVTGMVGSDVHLTGMAILLGLGSGIGYALYSIFSRFALQRGYHSFTISFYTFLIAGAAILPFSNTGALVGFCTASAGNFAYAVFSGLVTTVLPYIVYNFGLGRVETGQAAIVASIEPVVATLVGILLFHEVMTVNNIVGVVLVLGAIIITNVNVPGHDK